jgi:5-formyltetrahydrofolate cyclo-ligase
VKIEIRKQVLAARDAMPPDERKAASREIEERLFFLPEFTSARIIMFFASFRSEVDTLPMIRRALISGKRVVLPKVKGKDLGLFEIRDFVKDVTPGAWGIPEPRELRSVKLDEIDLILVPGAAFDERGNRIGYGAGFYDKLLITFKKMTVALAFEAQIVPQVPADLHDVPVKKIVTEKRVIKTNTNNQSPSSK